MTCVGDYKQATYRTNNSPKNSQYRDEKIQNYFVMLEKKGLCTTSYANTTRRFNQEICDFVNIIHGDAVAIVKPDFDVAREVLAENTGVYIIDINHLSEYCDYYHPVILRYDKKAKIGFHHNCDIFNYGAAKGATYDRIVIIPVGTTLPFIEKQTKITSNQTRSKFYVACTRARHSVVFAIDKPEENDVFVTIELHLADKVVSAYKFKKLASNLEESR